MPYDWQADNEGFMKWAFVNLMTGVADSDKWELLSNLTNQFTEIDFDIRINGVAIPFEDFFDGIKRNMDYQVESAVMEKLREFEELSELDDEIRKLRDVITERTGQLAQKYGITQW